MQIILRGPAAGYEAEHTARLFFPSAEKADTLPLENDFVLAQSHLCTDSILLRYNGKMQWRTQLRPQGADPEYALCELLYGLLCQATGTTPPWGMMTGVRPVRIIHDMRASGATEEEVRARFLDHFACTPEKFALALGIADLQKPVLDAADPMDCSVYAGIPFCPTRCSYCSFVSRTVGDKATRALVQPYVDKLCEELTAIRETADHCGLHIRTFYIGGGTPTSLSASQLEQLMSHIAKTFDLAKLDEYTVEAGRPDCTDAEKLRIIKQYGATRISINPQTFSDEVLRNIGRRHTAQDIVDCFAAARAAGHTNIHMDLIAGLPGDTVEGFEASLRKAIALDPENSPVHTLTLKRASNIVVEHRAADYADVAAMLNKCSLLADAGYRPICTARRARCKIWKISAGPSPVLSAFTIFILWRKSIPSSPPVRAVRPSWSSRGSGVARSNASSTSNIPPNISTALRNCSTAKRPWRISMHVTHRKRFVSRDLVALAARHPQELAALSEQHYHDQIEAIAGEVLAAGQRIVMLTGPSAAGKTTSAHKIADAIAARGHHSQVVSLDDFYIGEGRYPKNPDGSDDYESLQALDLEKLHTCLKDLYKTGVCDAPVFDFTVQQPTGTRRIDARDGEVIIEGLHA